MYGKMKYKNIQLINSPLDSIFIPGIRNGAYPPLNLVSLKSYLLEEFPSLNVNILDGEILNISEICSMIDSELVGISCNSLSYNSALVIGEQAKSKGSLVMLGGVHPTFLGKTILENRSFIDTIIYGDGEYALKQFIQGTVVDSIPNLIYRNNENIIQNHEELLDLNTLSNLNYDGIQLTNYFHRYKQLYSDKPFSKPFASYSAKGCKWRSKTQGGCIFCSIQHGGLRIKEPKNYWRELIRMQLLYDADFFWDVSDTFTSQKEWVYQFAQTKPVGARFKFQVYARSSDIDQRMVLALQKIGVYEVFLGLESGSNQILKNTHKGTTKFNNLNAIKLLSAGNIKVVISIVLGLPQESKETLTETYNMIHDILNITELSEINVSLVLPLPGSIMMTMLTNKNGLTSSDLYDPNNSREQWFKHFTFLDYSELIEFQKEISKISKRVGTFGLTRIENEQSQGIVTPH